MKYNVCGFVHREFSTLDEVREISFEKRERRIAVEMKMRRYTRDRRVQIERLLQCLKQCNALRVVWPPGCTRDVAWRNECRLAGTKQTANEGIELDRLPFKIETRRKRTNLVTQSIDRLFAGQTNQ